MERIVILAGGGALPRAVADSIASRGGKVHIIAIDGAAAAEFGPHATTRVGLGKIGAIVELAQRTGDKLVIIGHLTRPDLWKLKPDLGFLRHLPRVLALLQGGDDAVLTRVVEFFENQGITVAGVGDVAPEFVARSGPIAGPELSAAAAKDIETGLEILNSIGDLDIGQAVVVRDGVVHAIEGVEGTDRMLRRLADDATTTSSRNRAGVLVKASKPGQELRVDLPTIGPQTLEHARAAGLAAIAVEADRAIVAERVECVSRASALGVSIVGVRCAPPVAGKWWSATLQSRRRSARILGRILPQERDRLDILKAVEVCQRLSETNVGVAVCVVREHVLAVAGNETGQNLAHRVSGLAQWGTHRRGWRRGCLLIDIRRHRMPRRFADNKETAAPQADDLVAIAETLRGSRIAGIAVLTSGAETDAIPHQALRAADLAGMFVVELITPLDRST